MKRFLLLTIIGLTGMAMAFGATITVTHPGSGDSWTGGQTYLISWTKSGNMDSMVKIGLIHGVDRIRYITKRTQNTGSFSWKIPTNLPEGMYKLKIETLHNKVSDVGTPFEIKQLTMAPVAIAQTGTAYEYPDFYVMSIYAGPGDELYVQVANKGGKYTGELMIKYEIRYALDKTQYNWETMTLVFNDIYGKNSSKVIHTGAIFKEHYTVIHFKLSNGKYRIVHQNGILVRITVDPANHIHETNENNNKLEYLVRNFTT